MLHDYQNMSTDRLLELLAHETEKLTKLLTEKNCDAAYDECKNEIEEMQVSMGTRQEITANSSPIVAPLPTERLAETHQSKK